MKKVLSFIALAIIATTASQMGRLAVKEVRQATFSTRDLEEILSANMPKTVAVIRQDFPFEYQSMLSELTTAVRSADTKEEARALSEQTMIAMRKKYAKYVPFAPDETLKPLLSSYRKFLSQLYAEKSLAACNAVAVRGAGALPSETLIAYFGLLDEISANTFRAMAAGSTSQLSGTADLTDEDWIEFGSKLVDYGMTDGQLDALESQNESDANLCSAMIAVLDTIVSLEGPMSRNLRASFAAEVAAS